MLRIEITTDINEKENVIDKAIREYKIKNEDVQSVKIHHRSLDARRNRQAKYLYQIDMELNYENTYLKKLKNKARSVEPFVYHAPSFGLLKLEHQPVIVGFGPSGMASAYLLALKGYRPIVIERGSDVLERKQKVEAYWNGAELDEESNVQYGEGGAGAFSDGKLTTRIKDERVSLILDKLIEAGAKEDIAYLNHPHIGTDKFVELDKNIREKIIELGGEIRFNTRLDDLIVENNKLKGIVLSTGEELQTEALILAIGNGSGDTYRKLGKYLCLENKPFAVGVRVETLQSFINEKQYKNIDDYSSLPNAEYHIATKTSNGKGAYSFCMCPGGYVVPSESKKNTIVTNGMSYSKRDGINANSAIVVQVDSNDYGTDYLAGLKYQEELEQRVYQLGEGKAVGETVASFLNQTSKNLVAPTYQRGILEKDVHEVFETSINQSLEEAFIYMEKVFPGFIELGSYITASETRSSSPVRIVRNITTLESGEVEGVYPSGEGAGYSGGIVSSAIDGIKCAEKIIMKYHPYSI